MDQRSITPTTALNTRLWFHIFEAPLFLLARIGIKQSPRSNSEGLG
jgi:hypothetical protein